MNISMQLYSAREFTPWDDVLVTLAGLGYAKVEGFGGVCEDPRGFRALLDRHGLAMPSCHFFPLGAFEEGFAATVEAAKWLGVERLFCPAPEEAFRGGADAAAWTGLARRLEEACKRANDAGLRFGWHNHHWEFMELAGGGRAMEIILEHAPSIEWEIDVAWVVRGGGDPLMWIREHAARITTAHIKDLAPEGECADEDGWADVGHGTMDWPALMQELRRAGVDLFVMEHDRPSDFARFARRSIEHLRDS
ncbi:MAG: sugar phosphate isomerase/epimerase [Geminicoccaceae bacterium]